MTTPPASPSPLHQIPCLGEEYAVAAAREQGVMTVPGHCCDLSPGKARMETSPFSWAVRFRSGPPEDNVAAGRGRLEQMSSKEGCG